MSARKLVSRYVLLPVGKTLSGRKYFKAKAYQRFLEKTQYWERDELESLRTRQFCRLVRHCYDHVPFYRGYMDREGLRPDSFERIGDIVRFPLLSKEDVNRNQAALRASNYADRQIDFLSTGGSTGLPTHFGRDRPNEYRVDANNWRFWKYAGYELGMKLSSLWGNELELARGTSLRERSKMVMENTKMLNCFDLSEERLKEHTQHFARHAPEVVRGYSTAIHVYARYCQENNVKLAGRPKCVILTSDKVFEPQKREIADFFQCEVFEEYGCREFSILGHECSAHNGLHLAEELFIFEVLDQRTGQCSLEGDGEIVVTPLFNYAVPLLRYRLGDEVHLSSRKCSCGRTLRLVSDVKGRINDFVVTKRGDLVHSIFFASLFYTCQGISRYQVRQSEKGRIAIRLVRNDRFSEAEMDRVRATLRAEWGDDLEVSLRFVDDIELSPSGKRRTVVSSVASQYLWGGWRPPVEENQTRVDQPSVV